MIPRYFRVLLPVLHIQTVPVRSFSSLGCTKPGQGDQELQWPGQCRNKGKSELVDSNCRAYSKSPLQHTFVMLHCPSLSHPFHFRGFLGSSGALSSPHKLGGPAGSSRGAIALDSEGTSALA